MGQVDYSLGARCRKDFPLLAKSKLIYLDTAASAQKPKAVIEAGRNFYESSYANIHRGVYELSENATIAYEEGRAAVAEFIGANDPNEIVFTHGTTEALNLVAYSWGRENLKSGDEVVVSLLEHHANFVPWQMVSKATGAVICYLFPNADGVIDEDTIKTTITPKTKLVAVTALANALGVIPPTKKIVEVAHSVGAVVVLDGAQAVAHSPGSILASGADFYAFSAHKLYGPSGLGVLWGRGSLLEKMPPFLTGGDMIENVSIEGTTFAAPPARFEAGTPHITGVVELHTAIKYLQGIGLADIHRYESLMVQSLESELRKIEGVKVLGPKGGLHGLVTFVCEGIHPHDVSQVLSGNGIAVRAGHHCAQPLLTFLGVGASTRASIGLYNTPEDIEKFIVALKNVFAFFGR